MTLRAIVRKISAALGLKPQLPPSLVNREELSIAAIKDQFYPDVSGSLELFSEVWCDLARIFNIPPGLIRPPDRFGVELPNRPVLGMTDEDVLLGGAISKRFRRLGRRQTVPSRLETADQYIRLFFPVESRHGGATP